MVEPTGYTALDLIGFTDRGNYNPVTNYVKNDLVHYGGSIWRILIDDTMGQTPQEGIYYTVFVKEPTNMVERIMAPLEQNPATQAWAVGRQIINNDYLYEVIAPIAIGDNLVAYEDDPTNANIKLAPPIETQVLAIKNEADMTEDMIAPAESNPAAASHSVGDQIIFDNILYDVTSPIAASDALVAYPTAGYNIKPAAPVSSQIQALTNNLNAVSDKVSKSSDVYDPNKNGGYKVGDLCISPTDGKLKKCTTAITTAGIQWATAQNYFTDATLTDVVSMINHSLPIIISGHDSITIPAKSSVAKTISLPRNVPAEDTVCVLTGLLGGDWENVELIVDWINYDTVWIHGKNNTSSELTKNFRWCVIHA